jgi:hypothetical protein
VGVDRSPGTPNLAPWGRRGTRLGVFLLLQPTCPPCDDFALASAARLYDFSDQHWCGARVTHWHSVIARS